MKYLIVFGTAAVLLAACGVKGDLVREAGTEPPVVATSTITTATTNPTKPRGTLF